MARPAEPSRPSRRSVLLAWGAVALGGIFLWVRMSCDNVQDLPVLGPLASSVDRLTDVVGVKP